jgi:hypothetical protein
MGSVVRLVARRRGPRVTGCADGTGREVAHYAVALDAERLDELTFVQDAGDLAVRGDPDRRRCTSTPAPCRFGSIGRDDVARERVDIRLDEPAEGSGELRLLERGLPRGYYLDLELVVPAGLALTIGDDSGDLTVTGVADLVVDDDSGDVAIEGSRARAGHRRLGGPVDRRRGRRRPGGRRLGGRRDSARGRRRLGRRRDSGDLTIVTWAATSRSTTTRATSRSRTSPGTWWVRDGSGDVTVADAGRVEVAEDGSGDVNID